jgi:2-polyprenyl-3-methyl-5-hydroxy-6-metoxy-1,4-benzoquinol methylase
MATPVELNPSYVGPRPDVVKLVPQWYERVLDVGCGTGSVGWLLKESCGRISVTGVELDPTMAELARHYLDGVVAGDIGDVLDRGSLDNITFDCILLADVLEHIVEPWAILRRLTDRELSAVGRG